MLRKPLILTAMALSALTVTTAQAQQMAGQNICAPRAAIIEKLKAEFDEEPEAIGVTNSGGLFEILSSSAGTWTVLATGPNGVSCLVLSGDGWMSRTEPRNNQTTKAQGAKSRNL